MQVFQSDWQDAESYAKEIRHFLRGAFSKERDINLKLKSFGIMS